MDEVTWSNDPPSDSASEHILVQEHTEEPKIEFNFKKLSTLKIFHAVTFAVILEDALMHVRLLGECNNELRITKLASDMEELKRRKFGVEMPPTVDQLESIDHKNLGCNRYKLEKLAADRSYIIDVFVNCYLDLSLNTCFITLRDYNREIIATHEYRDALLEEVNHNKNTRRELLKQTRQQRNHIKTVLYDTDVTIEQLKSQVEDAVVLARIRSRYVDCWQEARTEQHQISIEEKENEPNTAIKYYRVRNENEDRVHAEVELLTNILISETLEKIESWMNKYDKDMEGMDLKIQIEKNNYQNTRDKRIKMEETYEKHDQMMKDWIHFKEEREKARQYHELMTKSAIVVQAWWRGLLVRLMLGPYKVAKKKGGKGKKK